MLLRYADLRPTNMNYSRRGYSFAIYVMDRPYVFAWQDAATTQSHNNTHSAGDPLRHLQYEEKGRPGNLIHEMLVIFE